MAAPSLMKVLAAACLVAFAQGRLSGGVAAADVSESLVDGRELQGARPLDSDYGLLGSYDYEYYGYYGAFYGGAYGFYDYSPYFYDYYGSFYYGSYDYGSYYYGSYDYSYGSYSYDYSPYYYGYYGSYYYGAYSYGSYYYGAYSYGSYYDYYYYGYYGAYYYGSYSYSYGNDADATCEEIQCGGSTCDVWNSKGTDPARLYPNDANCAACSTCDAVACQWWVCASTKS
eukprot:INCI18406.1.p1 GENE.INCI18406.1~~INCI18406.1.p1  ORF type:complete len:228 (-),score=19.98 INCI18406.1:191-874(-)